ncbi:hypothetical protein [Butyrivibrio sp. VCD2006]|uniref:hypothetical protein n=1 Tax=Butyrivibrio sp. VCD2006 TaxID=1280664 RepID=UPI00042640BE|nr:hypothetical protein [Butyrivibrio sp. VCD2006]
MEKVTGTPIEKWNDVTGTHERFPQELDPNTVGNVRRGLEDQIEQNDNSLDGIINNVKNEENHPERFRDDNGNGIPDEEEKKSLLEKLHECKPEEEERVRRFIAPELML